MTGIETAYRSFRDFAHSNELQGPPKVSFYDDGHVMGVGAEWGEARKAVRVQFRDDYVQLRWKLEEWVPDGDCA